MSSSLFDPRLPPHLIEVLAERGNTRRLPRNAVVAYEGEPAEYFCLVLSGSVRAFVSDEEGRQVTLEELGEGEYFGETVIDGGPRGASFITLAETRVLCVPRRSMLELLGERPDLTKHLLCRLTRRVGMFAGKVKALALLGVQERVVNLLQSIGEPEDDHVRLPAKLSQQAIATRVGASRSMINRVMKSMVADGTLEVRGDVMLLRPPAPGIRVVA